MIRVVVVVAMVLGLALASGSLPGGLVASAAPLPVTYEASFESPPQHGPLSLSLDDGEHHGWFGGDWEWWWVFMAPMMLAFWAGVIWLVIWLVRQSGGGRNRGDDPLEIARARYARGEINRADFAQIRLDLGRG